MHILTRSNAKVLHIKARNAKSEFWIGKQIIRIICFNDIVDYEFKFPKSKIDFF